MKTMEALCASDSKFNGIKFSARYFVPLGESLEIWQVTLTNESGSESDLSLFSAIEFCLWDANDDATNFQRNYSIGQVEVVDAKFAQSLKCPTPLFTNSVQIYLAAMANGLAEQDTASVCTVLEDLAQLSRDDV